MVSKKAIKRLLFFVLLATWCVALFGFRGPQKVEAAFSVAGFVDDTVVSGFALPTAVDWSSDGRMFVATKGGVVHVVENGTTLATPFIDLSADVNDIWDRGLLGLAVHPDFPTTPYVYLLFTYDPPEAAANSGYAGQDGLGARVARLIRVEADPAQSYNVALAGSQVIMVGHNSTWDNIGDPNARGVNEPASCEDGSGNPLEDCMPADSPSHTIGTVRFGPSGDLFVGNGDGADFSGKDPRAVRVQDLDSLAGKILRINPLSGGADAPADGYPDNPFYASGDLDTNRARVYSLGLRNPFRFSVDPDTGEPFIGDVGWGQWEEINTGKGANFGWPCYEGRDGGISNVQGSYQSEPACQALIAAVNAGTQTVTPGAYAYDHSNGSSSVNAGDFYKGTVYPVQFQDALFYADYNQKWIKYLTYDGGTNTWTPNDFATAVEGVVQVRTGPDTNVYYVDINGPDDNFNSGGSIQRIRFVGAGNVPPQAEILADKTSGPLDLEIQFDGSTSFDPDAAPGDLLTYGWDFGNGDTSTAVSPFYTYTAAGTYTVTLTVTDTTNLTDTAQIQVLAGNNPPIVTIDTPAINTTYSVGDLIAHSGTASDVEDGDISANIHWEVFVHHNDHIHYDYYKHNGASGTFTAVDHEDNTYFELCATIEDSAGLTGEDCVDILANEVEYTFDTNPSGLNLTYSGIEQTTPFTVTAVVGGQRTVSAAPDQGGVPFNSWSDAGAATHDIIIQATDQTLIANYTLLTYIWDGGGVTNNWSEAANWSPDGIPGAGDTVVFNGTSSKDAVIDVGFGTEVGQVEIEETYTGTITMPDKQLRINRDFVQDGGTFVVPAPTQSVVGSQTFGDFSNVSDFTFNGSAVQANGVVSDVLRMTAAANNQVGTAYLTNPIALSDGTSFAIEYTYRIHGGSGADGMAFILQNSAAGANALGAAGGGMGYGGVGNSIAVETDTYGNGGGDDPGAANAAGNHVAILGPGDTTDHLATHFPANDVNDGNPQTVWVDYDAATETMSVYLNQTGNSKPVSPILTTEIDVTSAIGSQMYLGFGAGTGGLNDNHDIESLSITVYEAAQLFVTGTMTRTGGVIEQTLPVSATVAANLVIDYPDFTGAGGDWVFNGNANGTAAIVDDGGVDVLRVSDTSGSVAASAFYATPLEINSSTSFTSTFEFRIHGANGADGMTFMLQNDARGTAALGALGGNLGYAAGGAINPSLAIEIDNYAGGSDPDANHIGILTNGDVGNHLETFSPGFDLEDGNTHTLWIDYNGETDLLEVYLAETGTLKPPTAVMSTTIDLYGLLGSQAYLGFSAGTGGQVNNHDVRSWSFTATQAPAKTTFLEISDGSGTIKHRGAEIGPVADLGNTTVEILAIDQANGDVCPQGATMPETYVDRCFTITPTTDASAVVRLWLTDGQRNGLFPAGMAVWHYSGSAWEELLDSTAGTDGSGFIYVEGTTSGFSPFTVGQSQIRGPLAVTLTQMQAEGQSLPSATAVYWFLAGLLLLASTGTLVYQYNDNQK